MSITKKYFGTTRDGLDVFSYELDNQKGLKAQILNYGAIIKNLCVKDKNGIETDVVLGRDSIEEYEHNRGYLGAAIGRHANRIEDSVFELNGKEYIVGANEGKNSLHGGIKGFDKKIWNVTECDGEEPKLIMSALSCDGEEGFPGMLTVTIVYTLTSYNALKIHYHAVSDCDTVCNLTNHSYFNLAGHDSGNIYNQVLQMNSGFYTPNNSECMPFGEIHSVTGTPFDFRIPKPIGQDIHADFEQIEMFGGYDHNFVINGRGYRTFAVAKCVENGISMEVKSDQSAVQLYTSNSLVKGKYKQGAEYDIHQAFCLETQCFPNAMKYSQYPSPILEKGKDYDSVTEYIFKIEK